MVIRHSERPVVALEIERMLVVDLILGLPRCFEFRLPVGYEAAQVRHGEFWCQEDFVRFILRGPCPLKSHVALNSVITIDVSAHVLHEFLTIKFEASLHSLNSGWQGQLWHFNLGGADIFTTFFVGVSKFKTLLWLSAELE